MKHVHATICSPATGLLAEDPDQIVELLDAWELAKVSYAQVLHSGVDRSDADLARDRNYRQLLLAGQRLERVGGTAAVSAAAHYLTEGLQNGAEAHFDRLWQGLLPTRR